MTHRFDNANRLTQIAQGSSTVSLGYDITDQLGWTTSFTYDANANLTQITRLGMRGVNWRR